MTTREQEIGREPQRYDYDSLSDYLVHWDTWRVLKSDWELPELCKDHQGYLDGKYVQRLMNMADDDWIDMFINIVGESRYIDLMRVQAGMKVLYKQRLREEEGRVTPAGN
jgi:hypothetical protein